MKRIILYLIPQAWLDEAYRKGRKDAGTAIVDASYWFSTHIVIYKILHDIGRQLEKDGYTDIKSITEKIEKEFHLSVNKKYQ